jgi:hypothetical protein
MHPKKDITVPVRIDPPTDLRIKRAARRLRTSSASVIRLAIASQLAAIEAGKIALPSEQEVTA